MVRNLTQSEDKIQQRRWNAARYAEEQEEQRISAIIQVRDSCFSHEVSLHNINLFFTENDYNPKYS